MSSSDYKIERSTIDELVVKQIKKWLQEKKLQTDDRLPSENALSKELGIGRHALREGLKRLEQLGVLESRTGVGTFVKKTPESLSEIFDPHLIVGNITEKEIYEVREAIEAYGARIAAERATEEDINIMERILNEMETAVGNHELFVKKNVEFHLALAQCTGNNFLCMMLTTFRDLLDKSIKSVPVYAGSLERSILEHRAILEAIKKKDCNEAALTMSEHLQEVKGRFDSY